MLRWYEFVSEYKVDVTSFNLLVIKHLLYFDTKNVVILWKLYESIFIKSHSLVNTL